MSTTALWHGVFLTTFGGSDTDQPLIEVKGLDPTDPDEVYVWESADEAVDGMGRHIQNLEGELGSLREQVRGLESRILAVNTELNKFQIARVEAAKHL